MRAFCHVLWAPVIWTHRLYERPSLVALATSQFAVRPNGLGFRILRGGNSSEDNHHEAVDIVLSAITETDADGVSVGARSWPHHNISTFDNVSALMNAGGEGTDNGVYREGVRVEEMSVSAIIMSGFATVNLTSLRFLEIGLLETVEPSTIFKVGNDTIRLDAQISNWRFCTPFGYSGGRVCWAEAQDIFLEAEGALPADPVPPPPHTLLIPRCTTDVIATLRFVCDPRLDTCKDLTSIKFYLGEADQPAGRAPNTATIGGSTDANGSVAQFGNTGIYEHNLTRAEVSGFLNVTNLTPGRDYVFWSVWDQDDGSVPESNSQTFDLSRTQYWQCPGTTIERNFEVGTSLRVSFKVNGSTPLEPVCFNATAPSAGQEHEREIHNDDSDTYDSAVTSTAAGSTSTAAASPEDASQRQLLVTATRKGSPRRRTQAQERLLADQVSSITPHNETICEASLPVADDDLGVGEEGDADWTWGTDGATFALGKLSRIRLSSDVMLDGSWIALPWGLSTADGALNEITIAMGTFESRAMYSTLIFFEAPEIVEDRGRDNDTAATWVAIVLSLLLLWIMGCCTVRLAQETNSARTWPAAVARARARSKGALDDGFGSADSDTDNAADCRELQFFPSSASKRVPNLGDRARDKVILPRWPPVAAPIAGWTTPRSIPSSLIASKQFIEGSGRKDWGGAEGGANEGPFTPPSPAIAESFSVPNSDGAGSSPSLVPARVAVAAPSSLAGLGPWGVQLDNI